MLLMLSSLFSHKILHFLFLGFCRLSFPFCLSVSKYLHQCDTDIKKLFVWAVFWMRNWT